MGRSEFPKDISGLVRRARELDWKVTWTRGNHIKFRPPTGSPWPQYVTSGSPSDHRSWKNCRTFLKRCGVEE